MTFVAEFTIPGDPIGQPRHRSRIAKKADGSQFIANYDPSNAVKRKRLIGLLGAKAMLGESPFAGPVACTVEFWFSVPISKRRKRTPVEAGWHTSKPDIDNALKLIFDSLSGIVYDDDTQVCSVVCHKRTCHQDDEGKTVVRFWEIR